MWLDTRWRSPLCKVICSLFETSEQSGKVRFGHWVLNSNSVAIPIARGSATYLLSPSISLRPHNSYRWMDYKESCTDRVRKRQVRSTYIKESLVTRVLWGSHAGASRDDHFYFSQINVAFTVCVLTWVIVSQLEPKGYRWDIRHTERENGVAFQNVFEYLPLYLANLCLKE